MMHTAFRPVGSGPLRHRARRSQPEGGVHQGPTECGVVGHIALVPLELPMVQTALQLDAVSHTLPTVYR